MKKGRQYTISRTKVASRIAHGPGSMFGATEAHALARSGRFEQAAKHAVAHNHALGPRAPSFIDRYIIEQWLSYAGFVR